ncbi:MAG: DEAD/DEAH box helicase [Spirochaetia bacterium]|nr:DEAD/DEAH box helicase [Spirochaetia bacterium]
MPHSDFESLGLMPACLDALRHEGYQRPTPIQEASIPSLLKGRDLLGCAQTGTGKTAAFALPTIQHLTTVQNKRQPRKARSLVVAPTRELAMQIDASFASYGRKTELKRACVYGGVGKVPQIRAMDRGVDVLVATPGRLLDLIGDGAIDLSLVEIVVFDEADRMLDMGFIHDVRKIIALLPKKRQTLLFSATMPSEIASLANGLLNNPVRVAIEPEKPTIELIQQSLYYVEKGCKRDLLVHLIKELGVSRAVVFSRTKHGADRIAKTLHIAGIPAGVIHANKGQGNRTKTMEAFRAGETPVLVATDLAARGIDVDDISHVFNFDMPTEPETYVHRIGRTARAGASGTAVSFCDTEEKRLLKQVERLLGTTIPVVKVHPYAGVHRAPTEEEIRDKMFEDRSRERQRSRGQGRGRPQGGQRPAAASSGAASNTSGRGRPAAARPQAEPARKPSVARQPAPRSHTPNRDTPRQGSPRQDAPRHETPSRSGRDVRSVIDEITGRRS